MGISSGGNDGLFKLAENAAPADGRIMPSERIYRKSSNTVSINEAISLLKKRREDPSTRIPGGLDDESETARKNILVKSVKNNVSTYTDATQAEAESDSAAETAKGIKKRGLNSSVLQELVKIQHQSDQILREIRDSKKQDTTIKNKESKNKDDLEILKSGNHRVTFLVNGMEFSVKCLSLIQDSQTHSLVLCFADDADAFFTPPMQSELKIRYDESEIPGKLFYFGMNFRLREVGLRFLGFLLDDTVKASV